MADSSGSLADGGVASGGERIVLTGTGHLGAAMQRGGSRAGIIMSIKLLFGTARAMKWSDDEASRQSLSGDGLTF